MTATLFYTVFQILPLIYQDLKWSCDH